MKTKIKFAVLALAVVAILAVAGCGAAVQAQGTTQPVSVNVNSQQGIWVTGTGTISVTPDIANVSLGVNAQAPKVADAQSQAVEAMNQLMAALTAAGIDPKDIQTQYYNISQMTKYDNTTGQSTVTGYQVSNTVNVKIRDTGKVGSIIDSVAAAAGDLTRINGISFSVDKPEQYNAQIRSLAMADAKAKAQQLASLAGVTLGAPTYIVENAGSSPIVYPVAVAKDAGQSVTPISAGQTQISLNVQVAYAIQ